MEYTASCFFLVKCQIYLGNIYSTSTFGLTNWTCKFKEMDSDYQYKA
jgi:hypothetical protein